MRTYQVRGAYRSGGIPPIYIEAHRPAHAAEEFFRLRQEMVDRAFTRCMDRGVEHAWKFDAAGRAKLDL